ncbi:hypothetical protein IFM89_001757 [Coptis chinensis]|uniref:MADS-box domain-containing protein n=1 Tax=Coptis chinensis TaxID=261450 RepID=A0A835HIU9_9MAGN|nr:hypothetical protein IFM89_001757 [Coptis chinensis]
MKKASEISTLCGAETAIVVFSPAADKPYSFGHPSFDAVADRFLNDNKVPASSRVPEFFQSYRDAGIRELNQQCETLQAKLEAKKKEGDKIKNGTREMEKPYLLQVDIDTLSFQELETLMGMYDKLKVNVTNQSNERFGSSSYSYKTCNLRSDFGPFSSSTTIRLNEQIEFTSTSLTRDRKGKGKAIQKVNNRSNERIGPYSAVTARNKHRDIGTSFPSVTNRWNEKIGSSSTLGAKNLQRGIGSSVPNVRSEQIGSSSRSLAPNLHRGIGPSALNVTKAPDVHRDIGPSAPKMCSRWKELVESSTLMAHNQQSGIGCRPSPDLTYRLNEGIGSSPTVIMAPNWQRDSGPQSDPYTANCIGSSSTFRVPVMHRDVGPSAPNVPNRSMKQIGSSSMYVTQNRCGGIGPTTPYLNNRSQELIGSSSTFMARRQHRGTGRSAPTSANYPWNQGIGYSSTLAVPNLDRGMGQSVQYVANSLDDRIGSSLTFMANSLHCFVGPSEPNVTNQPNDLIGSSTSYMAPDVQELAGSSVTGWTNPSNEFNIGSSLPVLAHNEHVGTSIPNVPIQSIEWMFGSSSSYVTSNQGMFNTPNELMGTSAQFKDAHVGESFCPSVSFETNNFNELLEPSSSFMDSNLDLFVDSSVPNESTYVNNEPIAHSDMAPKQDSSAAPLLPNELIWPSSPPRSHNLDGYVDASQPVTDENQILSGLNNYLGDDDNKVGGVI